MEGNTEFFNGRLAKKERKQTIVDELLHDTQTKTYLKRKYAEISETTRNKFEKRKFKKEKEKEKEKDGSGKKKKARTH